MVYLGETAGLLTSLFFAMNAVILTRATQRVGALAANRVRLVFALLYLAIANLLLYHEPLPFHAGAGRWTWLSLSGVIGLVVGDLFLFQAFLLIGTRLGILLFSLSTIFGALGAWLFFGETLSWLQIIGIGLTLGGIVWVILERGSESSPSGRPSGWGIVCGVLAALGQATGLVFSKQGLSGSYSPISGNEIRMLAAVIAMWLLTLIQGEVAKTVQTVRAEPSALRLLALAALMGPVIGVSLSLFAVENVAIGVASVLTSLAPIFMLPISRIFLKESLGWQAVAGTVLATVGVAVLFLA